MEIVMNSVLFKECVEALGTKATVLSYEETHAIYSVLGIAFPFGFSSIDWSKVSQKWSCDYEQEITLLEALIASNTIDKQIYLFWDSVDAHVLKTDLDSVINNLDDIWCVGFKTWLFHISLRMLLSG